MRHLLLDQSLVLIVSLLQVVCISVFLLLRSILNFVSIMRFSLNKYDLIK